MKKIFNILAILLIAAFCISAQENIHCYVGYSLEPSPTSSFSKGDAIVCNFGFGTKFGDEKFGEYFGFNFGLGESFYHLKNDTEKKEFESFTELEGIAKFIFPYKSIKYGTVFGYGIHLGRFKIYLEDFQSLRQNIKLGVFIDIPRKNDPTSYFSFQFISENFSTISFLCGVTLTPHS